MSKLPTTFQDLDLLVSAEERNAVREKLQRYVARGEWAQLMLKRLDDKVSQKAVAEEVEDDSSKKIER